MPRAYAGPMSRWTPPRLRLLLPVAAAIAGQAVAHSLDYLLVFPDGAERARHLHATGHAYWPWAALVATGAGVVAVGLVARRAAGTLEGGRNWAHPLRASVHLAWQAGCQLGIFAVMEVLERMVTGTPLVSLLHAPELWLGLALQVLLAAVCVAVLAFVERLVGRVAAALRRRRLVVPTAMVRPRPPSPAASALVASRRRSRAPPVGATA